MRGLCLHLCMLLLVAAGCGDAASTERKPHTQADGDVDGDDGTDDNSMTDGVDEGGTGADGTDDGGTGDGGNAFDPDAEFIMLAFGDSISAGLNIDKFLVESEEKNWSTGDEVTFSHFNRLKTDLGVTSIAVENVAISGATTSSLPDQLSNVETSRADYATILIGANDVCGWPSNHTEALETYKQRVTDLVDSLEQKYEGIAVLLVSVPDLNQLYELKKDESSCQQIWGFAGGCPDLLQASATESDRSAFRERWLDMNNALEEIAASASGNVRYAPDAATAQLQEEDISTLDCFHPSESGQKRIADASWIADLAKYAAEK